MAKTRTTKFQTYPQPYQFGGLNLPFLDQYTNLNKQWGSFWRGGDYFKQQAPNSIPDGTTMLDTTVKRNQGALDLYTDTQTRANNNYKGEWGDDAHNFYYRKDWDKRNPNATQADKDRFDQYASFEKTAGNLKGPDYTEALLGAGIDPGDYNSWYKARDRGAGQFGAAYDKSRDIFNKDLPAARKQMGQAMTNSAAGIFSGLNYMNSYVPPETINLDQGSKGVMYQKGGNVKGPGLRMSPMMDNFGATQAQNSQWAHFPSGNHAIDAIDSLLFSGRSKYYTPKTKVAEALSKYSGGDYSNHKYAKKTLGSLNANEKTELLNDIIKKEVTADNYNTNYAGVLAGRQISPSVVDYQVTSRQKGGKVNLTGFTPGTPSMNNSMNEIPSGDITMEQTPIPLLAIGKGGADNGLLKVLQPNSKGYNFKSKSTVEIPLEQQQQEPMMAKYGKLIKALNKYNDGGYINQYYNGGNPTNPPVNQLPIMDALRRAQENGLLLDVDPKEFYKIPIEDQKVMLRTAFEKFNNEDPRSTKVKQKNALKKGTSLETPVQIFVRPLSTTVNTEQTITEPVLDFRTRQDMAYAEARRKGLSSYTLDGKVYNTLNDPNYKAVPKKSSTSRTINTSQTGLVRDLIGNMQFGGLTEFQEGGNVRRAVYQAANQRPFYQEPGIDTRFMPDARFNRPSIYGNSAIYQGAPNQLQSASMIPTINPTIVEPMSGLGFNRDKLAAQMNVSNNVKLAKGGTQKVAAYQQMLKAAGYNIDVDGAWGPKTQAAYEAYTGKKAPSKTAIATGKAKVASNIIKNNNYGYNSKVAAYLKSNNIEPNSENIQAFYNNTAQLTTSNNLPQVANNTAQSNLFTGNFSMPSFNDILPSFTPWGSDTIYRPEDYLPTVKHSSNIIPTKEQVAKYNKPRKKWNEKNPKLFGSDVHPSLARTLNRLGLYRYGGSVSKFQFGGSINDEHSIPIFSSNLEDFGLTELQTEKNEVAFMPDGSIVDVKAKELHKKQDKHNVSDIMQSGTYVFSNDPKMKFGIKSKLGGVELGDMKLGKSVFKYKENEITPGPEDIMLKDVFFNNSKKELTTAEIAKNVKKNLPIIDMKNDYFADRAIAENKDQRKEYLNILKAFNEYKKPKQGSMPKAQYGTPIQPTQNGLDGVMGYGDKQMDPFKRIDNNMLSMFNFKQPPLPATPKMYEDGGIVPHAQFGWLADGIDAIGGWSRRAERKQRSLNEILRQEAQSYRDQLQQGVDRAGGIGVGTNIATYAASLNVPLQKYDDQSEQMAMYNAAANRAIQRLEANKYTASQGIGGASSLARYSNPTSYGDFLAKTQSQSDSNISRINQAIADLDMARANQNIGFISARNAGRNQSLNARDTQLYNANVQGIGNVGRSAQEATFNTADTKYRLGNEKMAYDAYLTDKAEAAKQAKQQQIRGYANDIGLLGLTAATGGFGGGKLFDKNKATGGQPSFTGFNPATFSGPNFQNPTQMSPANQQFNPNYGGFSQYNPIQPLPLILNRNGVNNGNFMNRNTDNWNYNFLDVNTWRS